MWSTFQRKTDILEFRLYSNILYTRTFLVWRKWSGCRILRKKTLSFIDRQRHSGHFTSKMRSPRPRTPVARRNSRSPDFQQRTRHHCLDRHRVRSVYQSSG